MKAFIELGYDTDIDEARDMINFFDTNDDGIINFAEFVKLMMYDTQDVTLFDSDVNYIWKEE